MKVLKYVIWIFLLFLLQTVSMNYIAPFGFRPDLILSFVVIVAIKEDTLKNSMLISIVCAVAAGALSGKNFSFCVLFYTYVGAVVFGTRKYPRYVPHLAKIPFWTFVSAIVGESVSYLLLYSSVKWFVKAFFVYILPTAFITTAAGMIIYFIASKTLFGKRKIMGRLITK